MIDRVRDFFSIKRIVVVVAILGVILLAAAVGFGVLGAPAIDSVENSFGEVTDTESVVETTVHIDNPNPVGASLEGLVGNYSIRMNQVPMATGEIDGIDLGSENDSIALTTTLQNERITEWWPTHIDQDESSDVRIDVTVSSDRFDRTLEHTHQTAVETDLLAAFNSDETRAVNADHDLADDPVLYINETRANWDEVTDSETPIDMSFLVYNPNIEPYVITQTAYEISMNDIQVGEGHTEREYVIEGGGREELDLTTTIDATALDEWWASHLDEDVHGHQVSELRIEFAAVIELPTGEEISVDLDALTYEEWIGTDIFEEGGDVGEPPTESADDDSDRGNDEADDGDNHEDDADSNDGEDTDDEETEPADDGDNDIDDGDDGDDGLLDDDPL